MVQTLNRTCVISLKETIMKYLDDVEIVYGVSIDLEKALDTVNFDSDSSWKVKAFWNWK